MVRVVSILVLSVSLMLAAGTPVRAQDTLHPSTKLERAAWVVGSSLAWSLFDYVGYNYLRRGYANNSSPFGYRVVQSILQWGIAYMLYEKFGLPTAISFTLTWWTWNDDLAYYGWANVFNPARPPDCHCWENREHNGLRDDHITWAYWTPLGLLRPKGDVIPRSILIPQAVLGFALSIAIL